MSNTYRCELVFAHNIKFSKGEQSKYIDNMMKEFDIAVINMNVYDNGIVFFTRREPVKMKHLQVFKDLKKNEEDEIKVYIEDDVTEYSRRFKM